MCWVKPHTNPLGNKVRKVTEFPKAQSPDLNPGSLAPELLLSLLSHPAHSVIEGINEQLYKQTNLPRAFSNSAPPTPPTPPCASWNFLAAWSPGFDPGMGEKHWSSPALPLPLGGRFSGVAAGSNVILLLAQFASLRHGAPTSNGGGLQHTAPHIQLIVQDRWARQTLNVSRLLRGKQLKKPTESCLL